VWDNDALAQERNNMAAKLNLGDTFPSLTLNLVGGGTVTVPETNDAKYQIVLFYRGHW
jgi:hypothetical protein